MYIIVLLLALVRKGLIRLITLPLLLIFTLSFATIMLIIMLLNAKENRVMIHQLEFNTFPPDLDSLRIFFISDIHRRTVTDELLNKIPNQVDVVMIGGDLTESGVPFSRVESNIRALTKLAPVYFVYGNNDYEVSQETLETILERNNVTILKNTCKELASSAGGRIVLLGIEDMSGERDRLDLALADPKQSKADFKILLSHNPEIHHKISQNDCISLVLSGHTHGGQIRFLGWGLYKKGKLHNLKNTKLLVSNGYGTTALPLRLGAPAETHYLHLKRKNR
ncbi:metallophosphoesterase [Metabacillus schmidteae]|uniref:metallophosphoesterase n=1 Tax=Metabacillus schmidteae TaxID=2730405 RepID=UPI001F2D07C1|nr:metallophosphoesterase [Metabacillus schmidteae]